MALPTADIKLPPNLSLFCIMSYKRPVIYTCFIKPCRWLFRFLPQTP